MSKQTIKAKVIHVVDGDTFDLSDGTRVRLQGVDAPELKQIGGRESRAYLENLIKGKEVTVRVDGMHKGRVIGSVYLGNENVGQWEPLSNYRVIDYLYRQRLAIQ